MDEPCKENQDGMKKNNKANRIMNMDSKVIDETTIVSKVELRGSDYQKKENKMKTVPTEPRNLQIEVSQYLDNFGPYEVKLEENYEKNKTLEENNDNNNKKKWNGRYQTGDKESNELPILYQEIIQNTKYAESGKCAMSK
ncbi:26729_t:CDS:2, partial [Gigaspora margarita]